jgi:hypothetical protein
MVMNANFGKVKLRDRVEDKGYQVMPALMEEDNQRAKKRCEDKRVEPPSQGIRQGAFEWRNSWWTSVPKAPHD